MSITVTYIRTLTGFVSEARLYKLSEPIIVNWNVDKDGVATNYVIVSAVNVPYSGPETYIFPADNDGDVIDWLEMEGSFKGSLDHEAAIHYAGWELEETGEML